MQTQRGLLVILMAALFATAPASAFVISADQKIDGATAPQIVGTQFAVAGDNTITATGATPDWNYDWSSAATPGLSLGAYKLYASDNDSVQGTITLDLAGGNITGNDGLAILTHVGVGTGRHSDHVVIQNVGDIAMGGIDTHADNTGSTLPRPIAGNVTIGENSVDGRAGSVRVNYIYTQVGADATTLSGGYGYAGSVAIHSSGDVLIQNADGSVRGDIVTRIIRYNNAGTITVNHQGSFVANDLISEAYAQQTSSAQGGDITIAGNVVTGLATGDFVANRVSASYTRAATYSGRAGDITITGYNSVTVSELLAYGNGTSGYGGGIEVTEIAGDITISGVISADGRMTSDPLSNSRDGYAKLYTKAGSSGAVTVAALDLEQFVYIALSSDSGASVIEGALDNFLTAAGSGSGTNGDPFVTTQAALRAPDGQIVYYNYEAGGLNDYLGGHTYRIADLDGNAGVGGYLVAAVPVPEPATLSLLAMGGLAMGGTALRRRGNRR